MDMKKLSVINTENLELCGKCGGKCCKSLPGSTHPSEWGSNEEEIKAALTVAFATKKWSIDWWEGDPREEPGDDYVSRGYYVRPRVKGIKHLDHAAWSGECIFLTSTGCELEHDKRPIECRALVPHENFPGKCSNGLEETNKRLNAIAWIPYNSLLDWFVYGDREED